MIRANNPLHSQLFIRTALVIATISVVATAFSQDPKPRRRPRPQGSGIKSDFVIFPNLPKAVNFPFFTLDHTKFNSTLAYVATLPKGFGGKLKQPQQVLFMCYGYKKGGNTRIYETPAVPGLTPEQMTHLIADARIFKDVNKDDKWQVKGKVVDGIFVTSTTYIDGVNDAALNSLTKKHWLR